jgi:hypothetical protein
VDHYRQQQAAAKRAAMLKLEAERLEKEAEYENLRSEYDMYLGAMQAPAAAPMPVAMQAAAQEPERVGAGVYALIVVAVMMAFAFGSVWRDVSHRERAARQADSQGSWGHSRPASAWGEE